MTDQPSDEAKLQCRSNILVIFPDIDPDHLTALCEQGLWLQDGIIEQILNEQESGRPYPRAPRPSLKRKREDLDDEESTAPENWAKKFDNEERRARSQIPEYFIRWSVFLFYNVVNPK